MERTMQSMREACKNTPMEIVNYNYARFVVDPDEVNYFSRSGHDIMKEFADEINGSAEGLKASLGFSISAKISGKEKNVILIEGTGKLFDANPDAFIDIARLKSRIVDRIEGTTAAPVISTAADMVVPSSQEKPPVKTVAKPVMKPVPAKQPATQKSVPAKQAAVPAKPAKREGTTPASPATPAAQPTKPLAVPSDGNAFVIGTIKTEQLVSKEEVVKRYIAKFHVNQQEAEKVIDDVIKSTKGVEFTDGFIFMNKA